MSNGTEYHTSIEYQVFDSFLESAPLIRGPVPMIKCTEYHTIIEYQVFDRFPSRRH